MARKIPPDRWERLIESATQVFIDQGYRRTQMADIAAALGVAKGTLYLYVTSKDALFDLVVRCADMPQVSPPALPVATPAPGATLQYVRERVAKEQTLPALTAALTCRQVTDAQAELTALLDELYTTLARNRYGIKLIDRSARDQPELAAVWFEGARRGLLHLLAQYLDDRMRRKLFRPLPDTAVAARLVLETVVFWAVHRHWDSHPQQVSDAVAKAAVTHFLLHALMQE